MSLVPRVLALVLLVAERTKSVTDQCCILNRTLLPFENAAIDDCSRKHTNFRRNTATCETDFFPSSNDSYFTMCSQLHQDDKIPIALKCRKPVLAKCCQENEIFSEKMKKCTTGRFRIDEMIWFEESSLETDLGRYRREQVHFISARLGSKTDCHSHGIKYALHS
jgi:hypothetical protein